MRLRGGSHAVDEDRELKVSVATTKISSFVDQRGEVKARPSWTVGQLKAELEQTFPGRPPRSLQRIFMGAQLLDDGMVLGEVAEGIDGKLTLLLDVAPPVDPRRFDADTAVPSRREGQLEAFCASMAAVHALQGALFRTMRGEGGFAREGDPDMSCSLQMKADFDNAQRFLHHTLVERPQEDSASKEEVHGPLHDVLRPWVRSFDVDWGNSIRQALFCLLCARFGAQGRQREVLTALMIPVIFLYQTRWAKVGRKLAWNLVPLVPGLAELIVALLPAPEQALLTFDEEAYVRELYGPGGPEYGREFLDLAQEGVADDDEDDDDDDEDDDGGGGGHGGFDNGYNRVAGGMHRHGSFSGVRRRARTGPAAARGLEAAGGFDEEEEDGLMPSDEYEMSESEEEEEEEEGAFVDSAEREEEEDEEEEEEDEEDDDDEEDYY